MRVTRGGDCDDGNAAIRPGVPDPRGGGDQDCDGQLDESGVRFGYYVDADRDGFGNPTGGYVFACEAPDGRSALPSDCDDGEAVSYPGAPERCDTEDNDCDETVDEEAETDWYPDADRDGSGASAIETCSPPSGYVTTTGDCASADDRRALRRDRQRLRRHGGDGADTMCAIPNGTGSCGVSACQIDGCAPTTTATASPRQGARCGPRAIPSTAARASPSAASATRAARRRRGRATSRRSSRCRWARTTRSRCAPAEAARCGVRARGISDSH